MTTSVLAKHAKHGKTLPQFSLNMGKELNKDKARDDWFQSVNPKFHLEGLFQCWFCNFVQSLMAGTVIRVVVAYCLISWEQIWASPPRAAVGGILWPAWITLDVQLWSHRLHTSLHFCWTVLYYSTHFHWLMQSCVYPMPCLPQKHLAVFFP